MIDVLSVANMRKSDAWTIEHEVSGKELMLRAGKGIVEAADKVCHWESACAIVCGSGNNAGDGYVIASLLAERGIACRIFLLGDKYSEDGAYYYQKCMDMGIPTAKCNEQTTFVGYARIVDCIFGTGFSGEPRGLSSIIIDRINEAHEHGSIVISADINSGLNGDNGLAVRCVQSDLTVSVGGWKSGHFLNGAMDYMREKQNCDIGIRPVEPAYHLLEEEDVRCLFPARKHESNKGSFGYLALIGGSVRYSGAIRLANIANSALRAGAGVVKLAVPEGICTGITPHILESTLFPLHQKDDGFFRFEKAQWEELLRGTRAAAFGMGIGNSEDTQQAVRFLLEEYDGVLVIDADGLNALARILEEERGEEAAVEDAPMEKCSEEAAVTDAKLHEYRSQNASKDSLLARTKAQVILTPHLKEFSRLSGYSIDQIRQEPIPLAQEFAREHKVILLLKGPCSIITDGTEVLLCDRGCPGMATAGSGDVLSGIMAAVCAANPDKLLQAAAAAAYINGAAGELAQEAYNDVTMTAGDTAAMVREVMVQILG